MEDISWEPVEALVRHAEAFLTAQAQQHVQLEREGAMLRELVATWHPAPVALTQRLQQVEQGIAVLQAQLVTSRHAHRPLVGDGMVVAIIRWSCRRSHAITARVDSSWGTPVDGMRPWPGRDV